MTTTLRKITAIYTISSEFYLPPWIKEENIAEKWVKYDYLHILTTDGKHYVIPAYISAVENEDFKYPDGDLEEDEEELEEDEELEDYYKISPDDFSREDVDCEGCDKSTDD